MLCKLWDAAANDTVGGGGNSRRGGVPKAMLVQYDSMSSQDRKSRLAAIKCTGLVNGIRLAALSRPNF